MERFQAKIERTRDKNLPGDKLIIFIKILTGSDFVSKEEIKEKVKIGESAFYKYLHFAREFFPVKFVGNIDKMAYYSIDKSAVAEYFGISRYHLKARQ